MMMAKDQFDYCDYASEVRRRSGRMWTRAVRYAAGIGEPPKRPYQVEIHLASQRHGGCPLRCRDCLGQFLRRKCGVPEHLYHELLDDLAEMGVPSVVYSGIYTNPITDQRLVADLLRRGGSRWGVRLHAYGLGLGPSVRQAIIDAALAGPKGESYATFSKLTTDPEVFGRLCRPQALAPAEALRQEQANLLALFELAERAGFPLGLTLNCRITKINGSARQLADLFRWLADTPSRVRMRLTTDYVPTAAPDAFRRRFLSELYVEPEQAERVVREAIAISGLTDTGRVSFRPIEPDSAYDGPRCYNRLLFAAVSASGQIYPCQGAASPVYAKLAYGDLRQQRFPAIWSRFIESFHENHEPFEPECPHCAAACESQINAAIHAELTAQTTLECGGLTPLSPLVSSPPVAGTADDCMTSEVCVS
jgi:radical SAM protein with 4Fe4S-binding SPASM domain